MTFNGSALKAHLDAQSSVSNSPTIDLFVNEGFEYYNFLCHKFFGWTWNLITSKKLQTLVFG